MKYLYWFMLFISIYGACIAENYFGLGLEAFCALFWLFKVFSTFEQPKVDKV